MNTDTCPDCSNHPCDCGLPAAYAPTPRERFRKTLDISTGVSELLADSNTSYISWLERELTAVTEQRDAASAEFYRYHGLWDRATKQLETVMYQRDRLAEALERIGEEDGSPMSMRVCSTKSLVKQALQSLNPDHTVDANDMIPAVKGGSDKPPTLIHNGVGIADMYSRDEFENAMKRTQ